MDSSIILYNALIKDEGKTIWHHNENENLPIFEGVCISKHNTWKREGQYTNTLDITTRRMSNVRPEHAQIPSHLSLL